MDKEIAALRGHVKEQRAQGAPTRTRYAPEFRQRVLALAREQRAQGTSIGSVARSLGLKQTTFQRWFQESKVAGLRRVVVEPVAVDSRGPGGLVVFAGPLRIEGLDVTELARLVRGLA